MFKQDLDLLKAHNDDVVVLFDDDSQGQIAIAPAYQGRVITSTANGPGGISFGWINTELIESGKLQKHINAFGGEDRFWMGPEGGQFAIFFPPGSPDFSFDNWQTPPIIDTEAYDLVSKNQTQAVFTKQAKFANYSGTQFDIQIDRTISLLNKGEVTKVLNIELPKEIKFVAYKSDNRITNQGQPWKKETGLLSIWILGMFNPSDETMIVIPFKSGPDNELGQKVNDTYFGKVPEDRLIVKEDVLFFKGDGKMRGKIGIGPNRAKNICGSYDAVNKALTLVKFDLSADSNDYVNSMWEFQDDPYNGDVVNSYNDGPNPSGELIGPFYELETSSPAVELKTYESISHISQTFHFQGPEDKLDNITKNTLGVSIDEIKKALK